MTGKLISVGDNVVDCYAERGSMFPGGNAVNVAVHARRNACTSAYLGAVGTDLAGQTVLAALAAERVDASRVRIVDGDNASAEVRIIDRNRVFGTGRPGVSRFELTTDDFVALSGYSIVHTGDCSFMESQLAAIGKVAMALSFDFSEKPWDYIELLAPHVSIAIASSPSANFEDAEDKARRLQDLGPSTVAITLGAAGALLLTDHVATSPAGNGKVVDTLGAGDAFIARLLVGLIRGETPEVLLPAATTYATATCATFGAFGHETQMQNGSPQLTTAQPLRLDT